MRTGIFSKINFDDCMYSNYTGVACPLPKALGIYTIVAICSGHGYCLPDLPESMAVCFL